MTEAWADWVWLNGRLVRGAEAAVSVFDRGFLLGDGLFETLRAVDGRLFRPERHLARLQRGAAYLGLELTAGADELIAALWETLQANHLEDAALRLTVSRGAGPPGLGLAGTGVATSVIAARAFHGYPDHWYDPGATAVLSRVVKNEQSQLCGIKSISWLEHVMARAEAAEKGADEALLRNTRGDLVEGSGTNLFIISGGRILTPDLASGCLPGVTREAVLELGQEMGLEVREESLPSEALAAADEAILTNSLLGAAPLVRVEGQRISSGQPGPITRRLAEGYRALVAREAR
jgi:branched-chain amino acid aminotransferase